MPSDSKFTKDENGNVAVRVVSNDTSVSNSESMFTHDEDGNVAVRVVYGEGGGGESHNKGYYETAEALAEAYPTASAGDYAIVGATDTVWIWDTTTSAWKDSDTKGEVTSVNSQTGAVVLDSEDILPSQTGHSGHVLGTDGFVAGWIAPEIVQRSTMPQASEDELGNIYQFIGTTDANYTNGYFYKCVSDGQQPATYSWTQTDVQPHQTIPNPLPDQTGNSGKFLTTDGTDASWSDKPLVNKSTSATSVCILSGTNSMAQAANVFIGYNSKGSTNSESNCVGIGYMTEAKTGSIAIGAMAKASGSSSIQLSTYTASVTNSDANTFKVANANGNFEIMSADGTIPTGRLTTLLEALYPVGSVYLGTQSTCPLATLLPNSTWALVAADKALWTGDGTNGNTTIAAALPNIKAVLTLQDGAGASKKFAPGCTVSGAFTKENLGRDAVVTGSAVNYDNSFDLGINAHESNSIYDDNATTVQPPAYVVNVWRRTA